MDVDIVVTWVDMNDPQWRAVYDRFAGDKNNTKNGVSKTRFRDNGLLRYWFRGIEKYAPWVRKIHFIASSRLPEWLDADNPRLNVVRHEDYIPAEFLPTFNSVVIERYINRIPGLADRFVYFNDDFFVINHLGLDRFFRDGLPCDIAAFQPNPSWSQWYVRIKNNIRIINRCFDKKEVLKRDHDKWFDPSYGSKLFWNYLLLPSGRFTTLCAPHNAQPYLKSTFEEVWQYAGAELAETSVNKFRALNDLTPELFRTWQICQGNFVPYNTYKDTKMFPLMVKADKAVKAVREQKYSLVCLNDNAKIANYDEVMARLAEAFEHILPEKSSFEK